MKKNYIMLVALFFMVTLLNAQTSLTFTADTAVDNGQNITETITTGGVTYVLTATASIAANLDDLGGGDLVFFAGGTDNQLRPLVITLTADGSPISFNLTEIDYDTIGAGSITITNQSDAIITPTTLYPLGAGSITPSNTINATNISSFNIVPSDNDDLNDFGFHNIDVTIPVPCTEPDVPTVTTNAVCVGSMATLNISGDLNDATEWHIYSDMAATDEIGTTTTTTFNVIPTTTTTYYVRGEGGCTTPAALGNTTVTVDTADNTVSETGNMLTANQVGATYQWFECPNTLLAGETNQSFTALTNGDYKVVVTIGSCIVESTCVTVSTLNTDVFESETKFSMYPNPSSDTVKIKSTVGGNFKIMNLLGQTVKTFKVEANVETNVSVGNLNEGMYLIIGSNRSSQKLIIKK